MNRGPQVTVLYFDVENGVQGDGYFCALTLPIARALARSSVFVTGTEVTDVEGGKTLFELPLTASKFAEKFDTGSHLETPFSFHLVPVGASEGLNS